MTNKNGPKGTRSSQLTCKFKRLPPSKGPIGFALLSHVRLVKYSQNEF